LGPGRMLRRANDFAPNVLVLVAHQLHKSRGGRLGFGAYLAERASGVGPNCWRVVAELTDQRADGALDLAAGNGQSVDGLNLDLFVAAVEALQRIGCRFLRGAEHGGRQENAAHGQGSYKSFHRVFSD